MKISVIVPTRNSGRTLAACLGSLRHQTHEDVEVIVVDNRSDDDTAPIALQLADIIVDRGPERSAQRNRGAWLANGEIVVFIDSDMVLEPTVLADLAETFQTRPEVGAVIIPERSFGTGFLASCRVLEKSLYVGQDDVEAPRAFRTEVFDLVGRWDETLTAAEDWDLADRTRAAGVAIARVSSWIWHDEGKISLRAQFTKKRYYGRWVAEYLSRSPEARRHLGRPGLLSQAPTLLRTPVRAGGLVVLKTVETAGLVTGMRKARRAGQVGPRRVGAAPARARVHAHA
jgi:glycosyltransferase involved in cell wall biosynthesis